MSLKSRYPLEQSIHPDPISPAESITHPGLMVYMSRILGQTASYTIVW